MEIERSNASVRDQIRQINVLNNSNNETLVTDMKNKSKTELRALYQRLFKQVAENIPALLNYFEYFAVQMLHFETREEMYQYLKLSDFV